MFPSDTTELLNNTTTIIFYLENTFDELMYFYACNAYPTVVEILKTDVKCTQNSTLRGFLT